MTDHAEFIATILDRHRQLWDKARRGESITEADEPDAARLIYADWLEEQGNPLGEFIRVQCELANLSKFLTAKENGCTCRPMMVPPKRCGYCVKTHEFQRLREREAELWPILRDGFLEPLRQFVPRGAIPMIDNRTPGVLNCGDGASIFDFRSGFVDEISCRLADWIGTECSACSGRGRCWGDQERPCEACHGTGRVGGHGPAIVRAAPISVVRVTDREPRQPGEPYWSAGDVSPGGAALPVDVFDLLADYARIVPHNQAPVRLKYYHTLAAAHAALSDALICWARQTEPATMPPEARLLSAAQRHMEQLQREIEANLGIPAHLVR